MNVSSRKARLVGLITIVIIGLIILFVLSKVFSYVNRPVETVQNADFKDDGFNISINGEYINYVTVSEKYTDEGARAYASGKNISDDIIVSYYKDDEQVSSIDTKSVSTYVVKYEVSFEGRAKEATRVVIITDNKKPHLIVPDTVTITSDEAISYDVQSGVVATDNTGNVSFECDNTLSMIPGDYVIKCRARDANGNEVERNRLIKVVNGIDFEYKDGKLTIKYPSGDYNYRYSLDNGNTWQEASITQQVSVSEGNVLALVLEGNNYKMSSTYYVG